MNFNLLKEFLESGLTQQKFAAVKGFSVTCIRVNLIREMRLLRHTKVVDAEKIIGDTSMYNYDVRRNKENWLKGISAYEEAMLKPIDLDTRKVSELTVSEFLSILSSGKIIK